MSQDLVRTLWEVTSELRSDMDAAEYKQTLLGPIFLQYLPDAFDERRAGPSRLLATTSSNLHFEGPENRVEALEDKDYYSVVQVVIEVLSTHKGKVYDPCCSSGGMFVESEKFVEPRGGLFEDTSIYGEESNQPIDPMNPEG